MSKASSKSILFELLRTFVTMSHTLNLSKTDRILGITRQTARRHIDTLEEARGEKLFELHDRQYYLTQAGTRSLKKAELILAQGETWLAGQLTTTDGLEHIHLDNVQGYFYCSQQHHLHRLCVDGSPMMQQAFHCWANANMSIERSEFQLIRPYLIIYRRHDEHWIRIEIGEKSSYASWFGWESAKSSLGYAINISPAGVSFDATILQAYLDVYEAGGIRFDHVCRLQTRGKHDAPVPCSFQRLLLGCTFPDGSPALAVLVDRTHSIEISGIDEKRIKSMPKELLMKFNPVVKETSDTK